MAFRRSKGKFGAVRTADGFPSKLESAVNQQLLLREKAGEITNIKRQQVVELPCGIRWRIDFSFEDVASGKCVFAEAKGFETETYRLKKRMYCNCPAVDVTSRVEIWKGSHERPKLDEVVKSKKKT